ncbi:MAG: DUF4328 domain-containing protein [Solirubrobacteraceae bacterium]|nr:DUF4328 domain-containing protein [Solirubrobacteraceae bacterium]
MPGSQSSGYRSPRIAAYVVIALLAVGIVADAIAFLFEIGTYGVLAQLERGVDVSIAELQAAETRSLLANLAQLAAYWMAIIAFVFWFARAYRNGARLGARGLRYKPGWAIGAWFVPILNLVRPKRIANDIWRAADPALGRGADGWQSGSVSSLIHWWWGVWLFSGLVGNTARFMYSEAGTLGEQLRASTVGAIVDVVFIVASVLAILVVRALTARQEERARTLDALESEGPPGLQTAPAPLALSHA